MRKTAIFVEGQTEQILVRELLLKTFQYQNIAIECFSLFQDYNLIPTEYPFPNESAEHYFQILNVGNDNSVLSRMLRREAFMLNAGFTKIIGLRDMYSKDYRDAVKNATIDDNVNKHFIEMTRMQIKSPNMSFSYAIMEVEAWMLGLSHCFEKIDKRLTNEYLLGEIGVNLKEIDPEKTFLNPAKVIEIIFELIGKNYSKSKGDINAIVHFFEKEDFIDLLKSEKCASFKEFYEYLLSFN